MINGLPIRPPSICGMSSRYYIPVQDNINVSTTSNPLFLISNQGLNGAMINGVPMVPGKASYLPAYPVSTVANGDRFLQEHAWLAMNGAHANSNSYNQQALLGADFPKRGGGGNVFSSDTLKSIDTLPRDSPGACISKTGGVPQFDGTDVFENNNTASHR